MKNYLIGIFLLFLTIGTTPSYSQQNIQSGSQLAFKYFRDREYKPASSLFYNLYDATKSKTYFNYYIECLIQLDEFKDAESYAKKQIKRNPNDKVFLITLGYVYKQWQQEEKSIAQYNKAIDKLKPVKADITSVAGAFITKREYDLAAKTYMRGRELLKEPHLYHIEMANVYLYQRNFEKMVEEYLIAISIDPSKINTVQNRLQSALFQDIDSSLDPILKNQLLAKIQNEPENIAFKELLQWYFMQKKQFRPAFAQARSIDLIKKEDGYRLMGLALSARSNKDYETAIKCYQLVLDKGAEQGNYLKAQIEILETQYLLLLEKENANLEDWKKISNSYSEFFQQGQKQALLSQAIIRHATILSMHLNKPIEAIEILEKALKVKSMHPQNISKLKLELANIKLFANEKWDAILLYSQIEKANKNNSIGFEAKFRKAQVSYYMGELDWAKAQLDALKGSTSKLIANDAIALSQLISDNTTLDTSYTAMKKYAEAEFLLYQKKEEEAIQKLDDLIMNHPSHSLIDEVYYKKYEIYNSRNERDKALENLEKVIIDHPWDSLADKALLKKGILYEEQNNSDLAIECFKSIITDYPDSIFSVEARQRLNSLRK
ncbi:tetratricopeptide repeat protein [Marinifilum sp. N1E240]|uniref:tetratricopeptide repeat protein n=1 Tax=Marinifilum sp. N1E240 TaxID=2608082 RepID=UPI00128C6002|nr:tetratricopeptide repeat protein [Marinifilum sp. N1E240]MPQ45613.1 tetratricopeptide repeat protein [Marinifilum sp. N1E240]